MFTSFMAWPGAIAIGISLGLLGSGGSILTVPVLVYLVGQDEKVAIAGSLFIVGSIALAGSLQFVRAGLINWRTVAIFGVPGMAGTYLGAAIAAYVSGLTQLALFAVVMLLASYLMLRPIRLTDAVPAPRALWKIAADGLAVGVITGLVGVGGGFLIVPALVLLGGLSMHQAVATSLVIIALKSYSGFYKYLEVLDTQELEPRLARAGTGHRTRHRRQRCRQPSREEGPPGPAEALVRLLPHRHGNLYPCAVIAWRAGIADLKRRLP